MRPLFVAVLVLAACGRVGFDERRGSATGTEAGSGSGSGIGSGIGDAGPGDGAAAGCVYLACATGSVSCCANNITTCVAAGACAGTVIPCDVNTPYAPCTTGQGCCLLTDGGLGCLGPPNPC